MNNAQPKRPLFIIVSKPGQLANQLYFFSYVISLAIKLGGRVANPRFVQYAPSFSSTHADPIARWPARGAAFRAQWLGYAFYELARFGVRVARKLRLRLPGVKIIEIREEDTAAHRIDHEPFLESLRGVRVVFIEGWLDLSQIRFEQTDTLRDYFSPVERHRAAVDAVITGARSECEVLIGVHIRQGDYADFLGGRFFFHTDLYVKNMRLAALLFPGKKVGFIVCSNMPQAIDDPLLPVVRLGPGKPAEDLYALAACDYIIGPPSTFSRWASFYGQTPLWEMRDADSTPKLEEFEIRF
jgi:hypothetical protein